MNTWAKAMIDTAGLHGHPKYFEFLSFLEIGYESPDSGAYDTLVEVFEWACFCYKQQYIAVEHSWFNVASAGLEYLVYISGNEDIGEILQSMAQLHNDKNAGYAGHDNENPLANFYACNEYLGIGVFAGCLVRLCDKYERIKHLREDPNNDKVNESIIETTNDLIAYSLIASILYLENGYA